MSINKKIIIALLILVSSLGMSKLLTTSNTISNEEVIDLSFKLMQAITNQDITFVSELYGKNLKNKESERLYLYLFSYNENDNLISVNEIFDSQMISTSLEIEKINEKTFRVYFYDPSIIKIKLPISKAIKDKQMQLTYFASTVITKKKNNSWILIDPFDFSKFGNK